MCVLEVRNCLIYSSTIVQVFTNILWCRPDVIHLDCNHSKGFSAPGPLSEARGETRVSSNAVEGAHATLYKFIRQWLGTKIGRGKNELLVKDIGVMMLNWKWGSLDPMQQVFLWMR